MKSSIIMSVLFLAATVLGQEQKKPVNLRTVLLDQLRTTHNTKEWFVDANTAVSGLTPEQASWKEGKGNHSVGQLAYHLVFWNRRELAKLKGETPEKFSGDNEETFDKFDAKQWQATVQQLDQVMKDLEHFIESADDSQLQKWAPEISHIATHNAYHIGQMIFVRKLQGVWDPEKGVK